jgi:hypothetical protein
MGNKLRTALAAALLAASAVPAAAWGPTGHSEVGRVADALLTGNARRHVRSLIGIPLATAGPWADCLRDVHGATGPHPNVVHDEKYRATCGPFWAPAQAKRERQMVDYVRRNTNNCRIEAGGEDCHLQYHYEDIALQRDAYASGIHGTNDHDLVGAARAAILVLEGHPSPAPYRIGSKREALMLLAHFIGDLHQPLHVGAVYLDAQGNRIDPDSANPYDPGTFTRGGNFLYLGGRKLHSTWDGASAFPASGSGWADVLQEARAVPPTAGPPESWPEVWANESLRVARDEAFQPLTFDPRSGAQHWNVRAAAGYQATVADLQRRQVERAGARLAQILNAIWPGN